VKRPGKIEKLAVDAIASYDARHGIPVNMIPLRNAIEEAYPGAISRAIERREAAQFEAKFTGKVPPWAKRYVAKHWPTLEHLTWRRSRHTLRGTCDGYGRITVTERIGTDEERMRILVLHEIAHRRGYGHDEKYTAELRRLLVAEGLYRAALKSGLTGQSKLRRVKAATGPR
jgi:hypothetical protein